MEHEPTFEALIERARKGTDADWDFIEANLSPGHLTAERVDWARKTGIIDDNDNVRDYAATVIAKSDVPLGQMDQAWLVGAMIEDEYGPVRWWLANALYKRSNRHPEVVATWEGACTQENPAGEFARKMLQDVKD